MYPLTTELVDFLLGTQAQVALDDLAAADLGDQETLRILGHLRGTFTPAEAAALLDQAHLRRKAGAKFPNPERLLFVDEALEQATGRAVAVYRAAQFTAYPRVADLGCGIGADTIALAEAGIEVLAVERDPVRARIAGANVRALGLDRLVRVARGDWTQLSIDARAAFVDPDRRVGGRRVFRLDEMEPPLAAILRLCERVPDVAVKVAPGVADDEIPPEVEVEFISEKGGMKEALLRLGGLRLGAARRATLLPGPYHLDSTAPAGDVPVALPRAFIYEPDPAVLRATLVRPLAVRLGAAQLDTSIAYLTGDAHVQTPFARAWRVSRHGRFHVKTLNRWLREIKAGSVTVKKRGSPVDPESFRRRLKTVPGGAAVTVFLTWVGGRPWMIVATDV